ncbi:MAG: dipeptidase [Gemmatimonadota bacterium]
MNAASLPRGLFVVVATLAACGSPAQEEPAARARRIHREAIVIDGHNDLPWRIREEFGASLGSLDLARRHEDGHTDLPRLQEGGVDAQFFAAYVPVDFIGRGALRVCLEQIDLIHRLAERYPELDMAYTAADVRRIAAAGRIAALIGIEGGHCIENSIGTLRKVYDLGARYMTLTHANTLDWADAATDSARHEGLTPFGEEIVREMNRLGMLVDLSHVSPETMRDAIRVSVAPVLFSHSSARAVADHVRNVPDDVLRLVKENGGVVMINFFSGFVVPEGAEIMAGMFDVMRELRARYPNDDAAYARALDAWRAAHPVPRGDVGILADHIDHVVRIAGVDHVGLGSDYDGVSVLPEGMEDVSRFPVLTEELLRRGYAESDVEQILGGNLLRAFAAAEQVAARIRAERAPSEARLVESTP